MPTPSLSFSQGDSCFGLVTYDVGTPISDDFGTFQRFDGALELILVHFVSASGERTSFVATDGEIIWSSNDSVGPIEFSSGASLTGPSFDGFSPTILGPDFEDPVEFFPSTTLPVLDPVGFPSDTVFLLFENASGELFTVDSPFQYVVPEPSMGASLAADVMALVVAGRKRVSARLERS